MRPAAAMDQRLTSLALATALDLNPTSDPDPDPRVAKERLSHASVAAFPAAAARNIRLAVLLTIIPPLGGEVGTHGVDLIATCAPVEAMVWEGRV